MGDTPWAGWAEKQPAGRGERGQGTCLWPAAPLYPGGDREQGETWPRGRSVPRVGPVDRGVVGPKRTRGGANMRGDTACNPFFVWVSSSTVPSATLPGGPSGDHRP